jgi:hypothetical protein
VVVLTTTLAALHLFWAGVRAEDGDVVGIAALLGMLTLVAAVALARANVFEARLGVCMVAIAQLGLMLLALAWGLPGHERHPFDLQAVVALATSAAVLALLAADRRLRARPPGPESRPPYAL